MGEFILQRIKSPDIVVLHNDRPYSCGRDKKSAIVCCSPVVSRKHCIFYPKLSGVKIIDTQSGNGVFINGERLESCGSAVLAINDVIGIGVSAIDEPTVNPYIFRLKFRNAVQLPPTKAGPADLKRKLEQNANKIPKKNLEKETIEIEDDSGEMEIIDFEPGPSLPKKPRVCVRPQQQTAQHLDDKSNISRVQNGSTAERLKAPINNVPQAQLQSNNNNNHDFINPTTSNGPTVPTTSVIKYELDIDEDEDIFEPPSPVAPQLSKSPFKLKSPKQEPPTCYSQIDIVDLSDDEHDIFCSSQLFDDFADIGDIKKSCEIKDECDMDYQNDLFDNQDDEPPLIILSDDDEEEQEKTNRWYLKISSSQLEKDLNKEKQSIQPCDNDSSANMMGTDDVDEDMLIDVAKTDDINTNVEDEDKPPQLDDTTIKNDSETEKIIEEEQVPKKKTEKKKKPKKVDKIRSKSVDTIDNKDDSAAQIKNILKDKTKRHSIAGEHIPKQIATISSKSLSETNGETSNIQDKSLDSNRSKYPKIPLVKLPKDFKRILQIDPPSMPKGERHGVSSCVKVLNPKSTTDTITPGPSHSTDPPDNDENIFTKIKKLTIREKKDIALQRKKEDHEYQHEQKLRRLKYKFADVLPAGKRRPSFVSKEEKEEIKQDRKERLKKIAEEQKKQDDDDDNRTATKRIINKPKAKVSTKTRGDFLIRDQLNSSTTSEDSDKLQPSNNNTSSSTNNCSYTITNKGPLNIKIKKKAISDKSSAPVSKLQEVSVNLSDCKNIIINKKKERQSKVSKKPKTKKKVSFNDNVVKHFYEIDSNKVLKKCTRKDTSMMIAPQLQTAPPINNHPKLEEFIGGILQWNPRWLYEQQSMTTEPPVVDNKALIPLLNSYNSYDDYYKVTAPLMLLELWHAVSKDYENERLREKHPTVYASVVSNSVSATQITPKISLTTFMVEVLVTRGDIQRQRHPNSGDLIILELPIIGSTKTKPIIPLFAYVTSLHQTVLKAMTRYNPKLASHVREPYMLHTYTMIVRSLNVSVATNQLLRMKTVSYLRSSTRMVQALQYLPQSPLAKTILKPTVEAYQLPIVSNYDNYLFKTGDQLNSKQKEAVLQITQTVVQQLPKICMIQGPPGTGKSKVIVNLVTEILYGDNRYKNKQPKRILVCAPSNAAIDEIAIRLMAIRSTFAKDERFKMVRIGKLDTMNSAVKSISVSELAKREVDKLASDYNDNGKKSSIESLEDEKSFLLARMNACKTESESLTITEPHKQDLIRKVAQYKAKYDFITNRQYHNNNTDPRQLEKMRRVIENNLLAGAQVITSTLSSCYTNQMESIFGENKTKISVCIVDEATQSTEAETLIPLMLGVTTLVLVGDPNQLPATVISQQAKTLGMDQSLFARLQGSFEDKPKNPVITLDTQYRMSYPISYWPNRFFYAGRLRNCAKMLPLPFHIYKVLNLASTQDSDRFSNTDEAAFVANMIYTMMMHSKIDKLNTTLRIGIITPYNNQRTVINNKLRERLADVPEEIKKKVVTEVNTVDSFQGQERDVIIMSCVRSSGIGFLCDRQRVCVALTRAKHTLIICGNFKTFERDQMWNALLTDARSRRVFVEADYRASPEKIKKYIIK